MPVIYFIKKENRRHVMPCFFTSIQALIIAPKMGTVLAGVKNKPLWPNLARESSQMRRKFLKYLPSLYLQHILLKKRIQGTLRPFSIHSSLLADPDHVIGDPHACWYRKWATQASPFKRRLSDMTEMIYIYI